jgi:hypothetical protein
MIYELFRRLPIEIILIIQKLVYLLNAKPKCLLNDITNYSITKKMVINKYHNIWIVQLEEHPPEHFYYLIADIYNSLNGDNEIFYLNTNIRLSRKLISPRLNEILNRNYNFMDLEVLGQRDIKSEFNIIWGLLTPGERNTFI